MSTGRSRLSRKQRYALALIVAIIGITFAFYNDIQSAPYKSSKEWNFDSYPAGVVPNDFSSVQTDTESGLWIIKSDPSAPSKPNVIAKLPSNDTGSTFHIQLMPEGIVETNYQASVHFKIISGGQAQAAGLVVRFEDKDNYFVLLADSTNNVLSLCKAEPGHLLCYAEKKVVVTSDQWHTLKAIVSEEGIAGFLDDKLLLRLNNSHDLQGQIGLLTKEDTTAYFDDLNMQY